MKHRHSRLIVPALFMAALAAAWAWWRFVVWAEATLCDDGAIEPFTLYQVNANLLVLVVLAVWWVRSGRPSPPPSAAFWIGSLLAGLFAGMHFLRELTPVVEEMFYGESGLFESITPVFCALAFFVYIHAAWVWTRGAGGARKGALILTLFALASLVIALEEISWGQHIWKWPTPQGLFSGNLQQETNLHNYLNPTFHWIYDAVGWGLLAALAIAHHFVHGDRLPRSSPLRLLIPAPALSGLLLMAFLFRFWHEAFEEMFALLLLMHAILLSRRGRGQSAQVSQ